MTGYQLQNLLGPKSGVIYLLFWYAVRRERCGDASLFDAILNLTKREPDGSRSHELLWHLSPSKMCTYGSPRAVVLAGPNIHWGRDQSVDAQGLVSKWAAAISVAPHTAEVAGSVVDTLLQISANPYLRPFIPAGAWSWLNDRPSLPPSCRGLWSGYDYDILRTIRALKDARILTSYLITILSEWKILDYDDFVEMQTSVRKEFKGIGMGCHRAELIQRLDSIVDELRRERVGPSSLALLRLCQQFKWVLQDMDQEATELLDRTPLNFIISGLLTLMGSAQNPVRPSCVPCLSRVRNLAFSSRRLGAIEILPRQYTTQGVSVGKLVTAFFTISSNFFVFVPTFCIIFVKHNSLGSPSLSQ